MRVSHRLQGWTAAFILFATSGVLAQEQTADAKSLKERTDAIFASFDKPGSPGCALGVIQAGRLIYARGYGSANLEHGIPNGPTAVYDIGSTSKQFTAASILLLAQQGKLSLDDDVRKFIPELPKYQSTVTIKHLLNHTSGVRDYLALFSLAGTNFDDTTTDRDALDLIVRQKGLNFKPGSEFLYSNSGYFLLSVIVKRTSGKSLAEFAKENIFMPLGMKHTLFLDDHKKIVPMRATAYSATPSGGFQTEMSNFEQTGDGAVLTSIEDLLLWDGNFYDPKVGGKALIDQLHVTGMLDNGEKLNYASGLQVDEYKGLRMVSHGGAWAGYRAELIRFPDQKFSVACLCNFATTNPTSMAVRVADVYLEKEIAAVSARTAESKTLATPAAARPAVAAITEDKLKEKVGLYRSVTTGDLRRITLNGAKLRVDAVVGQSLELAPSDENRFSIVGQPNVLFEFTGSGAKTEIGIVRNNRTPERFARVDAFNPAVDKLEEFTGTYFSEELNATYRVKVNAGKLAIVDRNEEERPLTPTFQDAFLGMPGMQIEFNRAAGRIAGFVVHAGRIRNVAFTRQANSK